MKHDPQDIKDFADDLNDVMRTHRDLLNDEPRFLRPLEEALGSAKTKYHDLTAQPN